MNTQTTLADARAALYDLVNPDDATDARFVRILNEVCQRFINNGKWKGNVMTLTFNGAEGFITLPYHYSAALGGTFLRRPFPIFTQFHKYVENGPGNIKDTFTWSGILIDLGDGFVTQTDITAGDEAVLRIYSSAGDNAAVVRVYGLDQNGDVIFDAAGNEGEAVTLAAPSVATTNQFSKVTGFTKPSTKSRVRLYVEASTPYQIAEYQPNETRPSYQRYQTGVVETQEDEANAIQLICSRRFVPVVAETDWVIPGNIAALRNGMQAWLSENATDYNAASVAMNRGVFFLNEEARTFRGGGRPTINVEVFNTGCSIGNVN